MELSKKTFSVILFIVSSVLTFVGSVLGTPFYIMEHVEGRIFKDQTLPGMSPVERRQVYAAMVEVLAKIHRVNFEAAGLGDFAKQGKICNIKMQFQS